MAASVKTLACEFVGTFLLVLTVGCNVLSKNDAFGVLSIASVLMVSIYAFGSVSGGHFNPAVTVAVFISDKIHGTNEDASVGGSAAYIITQLVAGVAAGQTYKFLFGASFAVMPAGASLGVACAVELLYTFMLCFVVLRCACSKSAKGNEYYGLAIGWVIVAGGYAGGWKSGGAFNPAVAMGLDVAAGTIKTSGIYFAAELVGAVIAAGAHSFVEGGDSGSLLQKMVSEFLGTFFLVLTVGLSVLGGSKAAALAIGASLMCMIYALGGVSGAHFNPAVTLALALVRKIEGAGQIAAYMGAQFIGGLLAASVYVALGGKAIPLQPTAPHTIGHACLAEAIYTFVLCTVVLHVAATSTAAKHIYGLAIGSCIIVGGYAVGGVSGASLNPAVSLGLDTSNAVKGGQFGNSGVYALVEFVGAGLAAGFFALTRPSEIASGAGTAEESKPLTEGGEA